MSYYDSDPLAADTAFEDPTEALEASADDATEDDDDLGDGFRRPQRKVPHRKPRLPINR